MSHAARLFALAACLVAGAAWAVTVAELEVEADALLVEYEDLEDRVEACPGGTCLEAAQIRADHLVLQQDLADLHADRATLNPCSNCGTLDVTIAGIDVIEVAAAGQIGGWDEQD